VSAYKVVFVGFVEYARSLSLEEDELRARLLVSPHYQFPKLSYHDDVYITELPEPRKEIENEEKEILSLMGYHFPNDVLGKNQLTALFRASVFHVSAHISSSNIDNYEEWRKDKNPFLSDFIVSMIEDTIATAYLQSNHQKKLIDIAFANALALRRLRPIDKLLNPATKIMAGLLLRIHTGAVRITSQEQIGIIKHLMKKLDKLREQMLLHFSDGNVNFTGDKLVLADEIYSYIEDVGPFVEAPSLPHTEDLGKSSIFFSSHFVDSDIKLTNDFEICLKFLMDSRDFSNGKETSWDRASEAESEQVINSWINEEEKKTKLLSSYQKFHDLTRFKSFNIPQRNYTKFLDIKSGCRSEAHRLIESLLVARDALDEDPRKRYGVLDLQEAIQVTASKSPRMDVFMLDENISKSYAWIILLDISQSMKIMKNFTLEILVMAAEAANQLLLDSASWAVYAFNDRFWVIKDPKEQYNAKIKSRIGGIKFEGFTYMPDAIDVASQIIRKRNENLKLVTVISDGWPFGYNNIEEILSQTVDLQKRRNITFIGIGVKSRRMETYFGNHSTVYTLRDLKKKFSTLYLEASRIAIET
jgi:hypothetical protein